MGLSFTVTDGNLSRTSPSPDGRIGVFMLMSDAEAASDANFVDVQEFFSLKEAKTWLLSVDSFNIDSYTEMVAVFTDIYAENPNAHCYFRFLLVDDTPADFLPSMNNRIEDIINYSNNSIRLLCYYTNKNITTGMLADINSRLENRFATTFCGVSAIVGATVDTPIAEPITLGEKRVAVFYAYDANTGYNSVGRFVGTLSRAFVHENAGWVGKFRLNVAEGDTFYLSETSADISLMNQAQLSAITAKGYIIPQRIPDYAGWYWNDSKNANSFDNDFGYIENVRVMDKAVRQIKTSVTPYINSPLYTDSMGKMTRDVVAAIESAAGKGLEQMQKDGEISGYDVFIDPAQNVLSTSSIQVVVQIRPVGVARNIEVVIGFTL